MINDVNDKISYMRQQQKKRSREFRNRQNNEKQYLKCDFTSAGLQLIFIK